MTPHLPDLRAIAFIALSTLIMAYSWRFNMIAIVIFIGLWLAHAIYQKRLILSPSRDAVAVFLLPFIATYSTLWSDYPGKTLYQGAEFIAMAMCVIIIARTVSIDALLKGIALGCTAVLGLSVWSGNYANDSMGGGPALIGLFGSKNMNGLFAEIAILTSIILVFTKTRLIAKLLYAAPAIVIGVIALYLCKSASSTLSMLAVFVMLGGVYTITRVPRPFRPVAVLAGVFAVITAITLAMALNIDPQSAVLEGMGKNPTLTGRTYLWAEGLKIGMERPLLGHGYTAFWVHGQPQAEKYWEEFYILTRTGFHFHNMYIQTFVDLGLIGVLTMVGLLFYTFGKVVILSLWHGLNAEYAFALAIAGMFLVRSFVEVDLLGPFGIGPMLFMGILPRLAAFRLQASDVHLEKMVAQENRSIP